MIHGQQALGKVKNYTRLFFELWFMTDVYDGKVLRVVRWHSNATLTLAARLQG